MLWKKTPCRNILILFLAISAIGCEPIRYYTQAIQGQLTLIARRKPITSLLSQPLTPAKLKDRFRQVQKILDFAQKKLFLPVDENYRDYVELERAYVVWTVYAAPEFSLTPKTWCYPLVGCLSYRSYFSEEKAHRYAAGFKEEGHDVYVNGTAAYSTLGWFDDPIMSSFVYYSDTDLAALIFHELAHRVLYVSNDTTFNESFATAVEQEGMRRWMNTRQTPEAYIEYLQRHHRYVQFVKLIMQYRNKLVALYAGDLAPKDMRKMKAMIIQRLRKAYQKLKPGWTAWRAYDDWFERPINNAQINTVSTYHALVSGFLNLLRAAGGNLPRFYQSCKQLAQEPMDLRHRRLKAQPHPG